MNFTEQFEKMKDEVTKAFTSQSKEIQDMARPQYEKIIDGINKNIEQFKNIQNAD